MGTPFLLKCSIPLRRAPKRRIDGEPSGRNLQVSRQNHPRRPSANVKHGTSDAVSVPRPRVGIWRRHGPVRGQRCARLYLPESSAAIGFLHARCQERKGLRDPGGRYAIRVRSGEFALFLDFNIGKKWAATGKVTIQQFVTELKRNGSDPVLSGVQLSGSLAEGQSMENVKKINPSTLLQHTGLGVFKGDRLVGWLGEPPSKTVNYVLNKVDTTAGYISCPDSGIVGFAVNRADTTLDVALNAEGIPEFSAELEIEADVNAVQCQIDISQPAVIDELEKDIEDKYNANIRKHIGLVQQRYGSDVFGFGEVLHRKYPNVWKKYRDHWGKSFKTMSIRVDADVAIRRIGSIIQPLNREVDEP